MTARDLAFGIALAVGAGLITALLIIAHAEVRARFPHNDETAP